MKEFFSRLNPTERRFVVGVAVLFFLVGNVVWVWPHFGDWSLTRQRMNDSSQRLAQFVEGTNQIPALDNEIKKFERQGVSVPPADQAVHFVRLIQNQAAQSGVIPLSMNNQRESTTNNPFFVEQAETITLQSTEKQLVNFLYNLGSGDSLIRVRVLSVQPDQSHTLLSTRATLVASYQKAPPARGAGALPPARTPAPAKTPQAPAPQKTAPAKTTPAPTTPPIQGPPGAIPGVVPQRNNPGARPGQTNLVPPAKSSTPNKK